MNNVDSIAWNVSSSVETFNIVEQFYIDAGRRQETFLCSPLGHGMHLQPSE